MVSEAERVRGCGAADSGSRKVRTSRTLEEGAACQRVPLARARMSRGGSGGIDFAAVACRGLRALSRSEISYVFRPVFLRQPR